MSNLLKTGEQWLAAKQKEFASSPITYARVAASVQVSATIGRSQWDIVDAGGGMLRVETRDFIIHTADLVLDAVEVEPLSGDRITEGDSIYEVSPPGPGIACWRWDGPHQTRRRISTKLVGSVP